MIDPKNQKEQSHKAYEYDKRGNLIKEKQNEKTSVIYEFDSANMLKKVKSKDKITNFTYDGLDNRIRNSVIENDVKTKDITYVIDSMTEYNDIIMTVNSLTEDETSFMYGNGLISAAQQESIAYYRLDSKYSVTGLYSMDGDQFANIQYDEFGSLRNSEAASKNGNIFSYTGHVYEESIELYYAKARYYDAKKGRMTSTDPMGDGLNWYIYCYNNPITYIDPSGNITQSQTAGKAVHRQIQEKYKIWTRKTTIILGFKHHIEMYIPAGIPWSETKSGYADIMGFSRKLILTEVYEIKPITYFHANSKYNPKGKNQLRGYINAIRMCFKEYPNVREGRYYNPDFETFPYSLDPRRTVTVYTDYGRDPGMIYYKISDLKKRKIRLLQPRKTINHPEIKRKHPNQKLFSRKKCRIT